MNAGDGYLDKERKMSDKYIHYNHHGKGVWVEERLKGLHREHCLCHNCELLDIGEDRDKNCDVARAVYALCVEYNLVLPVFECPRFVEKKGN